MSDREQARELITHIQEDERHVQRHQQQLAALLRRSRLYDLMAAEVLDTDTDLQRLAAHETLLTPDGREAVGA